MSQTVIGPWPFTWLARRAARKAIKRCHGVPYASELSQMEVDGMLLLERRGEVERDEGLSGKTHWHRRIPR